MLCITNNSIKYQLFVYTQLNDRWEVWSNPFIAITLGLSQIDFFLNYLYVYIYIFWPDTIHISWGQHQTHLQLTWDASVFGQPYSLFKYWFINPYSHQSSRGPSACALFIYICLWWPFPQRLEYTNCFSYREARPYHHHRKKGVLGMILNCDDESSLLEL